MKKFRIKVHLLRRKQEALSNFFFDLNSKSEKAFQNISRTGFLNIICFIKLLLKHFKILLAGDQSLKKPALSVKIYDNNYNSKPIDNDKRQIQQPDSSNSWLYGKITRGFFI